MSPEPLMPLHDALINVLPHLPMLQGAVKTPENAKQAAVCLFIAGETDTPRAVAIRTYLKRLKSYG